MAAITSLFILLVAFLCMSRTITATIAEDEKECADQLQNLAACIPYVSGTALKPTPECCADAEKVRKSMPKCLCVLIVESTDTSLALPINTTLALQMPAACSSDANVSDCPSILKLSPDSPSAKIFKDGSSLPSNATTTAASNSNSESSEGSSSKVAPSGNSAGRLKSAMKRIVITTFVISVAVVFL